MSITEPDVAAPAPPSELQAYAAVLDVIVAAVSLVSAIKSARRIAAARRAASSTPAFAPADPVDVVDAPPPLTVPVADLEDTDSAPLPVAQDGRIEVGDQVTAADRDRDESA